MKYDSDDTITEKQFEYLTLLIAEADLYSVDVFNRDIENFTKSKAGKIIHELINQIANRKYNLYIC